MRKAVISLVFLFLLLTPLASAAIAAPEVHTFFAPAAELQAVKTVFLLPAKMPSAFPEDDVPKAIKSKWSELIQKRKKSDACVYLTPADLLQKHRAATGARVKTAHDGAAQTRQAVSLAPRYADAVLSVNILRCDYTSVRHTQKMEHGTTFEESLEWEEGKWVVKRQPVAEKELKPAWTEYFADVELRLELWTLGREKEKLLFSCTVGEAAAGPPRLADLTTRLMEIAMNKLPLK